MNLKKHFPLIENFISYFLFKAIDALIPLIMIPYLTGIVSYSKYGIYAFAFSLIFYLQNIIQFGFDLSAVREIAIIRDDKEKLSQTYNNVLSSQVLLFLITIIILAVSVSLVPQLREHYIIYLFFTILLFGELLFPMWFFLGMEKMRFITIVNLISKSSFAVFCFLLIKEESHYIYIALYQSIGFIIAGIIAQIVIYRKFNIKFQFSPFSEIKRTINEAWSAFLTLVSPTIYHNTSIFVLGFYWPQKYSGIMEISTKVSGAFATVNTIMTNVLYPYLNRNKALIFLSRYAFIVLGVILSLSMFLLAGPLIELWLGSDKDALEIVTAVKYLSLCPFLASVISTFGVNGLMIYKKDKLYSRIIVSGSILGLILALILIPKYNYIGGALTIVIALSFKSIFSTFYSLRFMKKQKNV